MAELFHGSAEGYGGDITAAVGVEAGKIVSVEFNGEFETKGIGSVALAKLAPAMVEKQTWDVDAISGATISSTGARYALRNALISAGIVESDSKIIDKETEVVVVGCGITGITAALAAAEKGAKVIMIERSSVFGGNGNHAMGGYFVETYHQKEAGETFTLQESYEENMYFNNFLANPLIVRKYLGEGADTYSWLNKEHDARMSLLMTMKAASMKESDPKTYHAWELDRKLWTRFKDELIGRGTEILFDTKGTDLIQSEDGVVTGVIAQQKDGTIIRIHSKAVYIATGGYLRDPKMLRHALGEASDYLIKDTAVYSDGSGLKMAWAAGTAKQDDDMISNHGGRSGLGGKDGLLGIDLLMYIPILWVNKDGRRFMDENIIPHALFFSNLLIGQKGRAFIVFDQKSLDQWKVKKIHLKMAFWDRLSDDYYCPPVKTFDHDFAEAQKAGLGFVADTIEELARQTGMKPEILADTVRRYNRYIETGVDEEFGKDKESLLFPVEGGPFYAIRCNLQAQCTVGGALIDEDMHALREDDSIIPGLYVGGADAGGVYNGAYSVQSGSAVAWALTSGKLAGRSMVKDIQEGKI